MLLELHIQNFAIIKSVEINFKSQLTGMTGETGAGKSILLDAINAVLGQRASASLVRPKAEAAEICAVFDVSYLPLAKQWLTTQAFGEDNTCILRRIITKEGRSKAFINGSVATLSQLKAFGEQVLNIHGQHEHQRLTHSDEQLSIVDAFAEPSSLYQQLQDAYHSWHQCKKQLQELETLSTHADKLELLNYQIQELEELLVDTTPYEQLKQQHETLAKAQDFLLAGHSAAEALFPDNKQSAQQQIHTAMSKLESIGIENTQLDNTKKLLEQISIQLDETQHELEAFLSQLEENPETLNQLETTLTQYHRLSRKHQVHATELNTHFLTLKEKAFQLQSASDNIEKQKEQLSLYEATYRSIANALTQHRQRSAKQLEKHIVKEIKALDMPHAQFQVHIDKKDTFSLHGMDKVEFFVCINPGQELQPLRKIASGGELSRISLAIQTITAKKLTVPTLIFDEVDTGVSGKTAEKIGLALRRVSQNAQVLCITHLPQVAALCHHHLKIEKIHSQHETETRVLPLSTEEKIQELARLVGGSKISVQALSHAKALHEAAQ